MAVNNWFQVIKSPLHGLTLIQRLYVRGMLLFFAPFITVENEDRLPPFRTPVIFAFNHNCSFEIVPIVLFLLFKRMGQKVHFIVDWMFGYIPIVGWLIHQSEPIFTYNKPARWNYLNSLRTKVIQKNVYFECLKYLKKNQSIGIFPEGTRNRNPYELKRGHKGIAKIALNSGVTVLPIGVDFPKRMKQGKIPKLGSIILRLGDQMTFARERAAVRAINQQKEFTSISKSGLLDYFEAKVTCDIMQALAKLSGKQYPFKPPEIPPLAASYLNK